MSDLTDNQFYLFSTDMVVVHTLEQRWEILRQIDITEDADFGKKKSSFQMKLILILAGM